MARPQLRVLKALENERLKRVVVELELDKLLLKESMEFFEPKI
jgi:putative transposase